jgi:hypothetical protein
VRRVQRRSAARQRTELGFLCSLRRKAPPLLGAVQGLPQHHQVVELLAGLQVTDASLQALPLAGLLVALPLPPLQAPLMAPLMTQWMDRLVVRPTMAIIRAGAEKLVRTHGWSHGTCYLLSFAIGARLIEHSHYT